MIRQPEILAILAAVAVLLFVVHRLRANQVGPAPLKGKGEGGGGEAGLVLGDSCNDSSGCDGGGDGGGD